MGPGCAPFQLCLWLVAVRPRASQALPRAHLPYHTREQPRNGKREKTVEENSTKENVYSIRYQYLSAQSVHIQTNPCAGAGPSREGMRELGLQCPDISQSGLCGLCHLLSTSPCPHLGTQAPESSGTGEPLSPTLHLSGSDPGPPASDIYSTGPSCSCISLAPGMSLVSAFLQIPAETLPGRPRGGV